MCGIAGVAGAVDAVALVRKMTGAMAHRGPDGQGFFGGSGIALGHRRLAIVDLSTAAAQPMTSADGRWTIVFNGEIFNYRELRSQLGSISWRSASDTEVLLEACAAWGAEAAVERAVGMFAFALWDARERELTLVRDRVGEKPLVYFEGALEGQPILAFASEVKALGALHSARIDPEALEVYLALGYVPAPLGIFRGTRKLPAGHLLRWKNGYLERRRWWFPEHSPGSAPAPSSLAPCKSKRESQEAAAKLRALVADAVRLRMRADVPLALALSGGLDSSVVALEMVRQGVSPQVFTVIFDGDQTDLPYARQVAAQLGLQHEVLRAESGDLAGQFHRTVEQFDEPFADSSAVAALALARAVGGRSKVILGGDGGDEAFGGYSHYEFIGAKQAAKACAAAVGLADGRGRTGVYVQSKCTFRAAERARLMERPGATEERVARDGLVSPAASGALTRWLERDEFHRVAPEGALKHALWSDRHLYLSNDLTYKMDLALASQGVEGRAPLLDHRILEWTQRLVDARLVHGRQKKVLLRQAYGGDLPPAIEARRKHGFGAPIAQWLQGPLKDLVRNLLPCPLLTPEAQRGVRGQRLWTLLAFAQWARQWGASW